MRAAAVFALGTFVNSCQERTEHANSLDHSVALHLWNACRDDASPLVRAELVLALSYVVMAFEANFVTICRMSLQQVGFFSLCNIFQLGIDQVFSWQESTPGQIVSGQSMASPQKMTSSTSSPSLDRMGVVVSASSSPSLHSVSSANFASGSSLASGGVYQKIWAGLKQLAADPHPQVINIYRPNM